MWGYHCQDFKKPDPKLLDNEKRYWDKIKSSFIVYSSWRGLIVFEGFSSWKGLIVFEGFFERKKKKEKKMLDITFNKVYETTLRK